MLRNEEMDLVVVDLQAGPVASYKRVSDSWRRCLVASSANPFCSRSSLGALALEHWRAACALGLWR